MLAETESAQVHSESYSKKNKINCTRLDELDESGFGRLVQEEKTISFRDCVILI